MRSTLKDVAREAGVSSATVDRVLNNRPGVRRRTREVVIEAARKLGYVATVGTLQGLPEKPWSFDFILPAGTGSFMNQLAGQIEIQSALAPEAKTTLHRLEQFTPDALAAKLHEIADKTDAVGVNALDHPTVRQAIGSLVRRGVKIVTLASDIHHSPRAGYVGIDNRSAGRLAGHLVGRLVGPGRRKVGLLAGWLAYRGHEEREAGFRHILAESFPTSRPSNSPKCRTVRSAPMPRQ